MMGKGVVTKPKGDPGLPRPKKYTLRQALQRFLLLTRCTAQAYRTYAARWTALWGERDVRALTLADLREWRVIALRTFKPSTIQIQLVVLHNSLCQAQEDGYLPKGDTIVVELGWMRVSNQRTRFFSPGEIAAIEAVCSPDLLDYFRFSLLTGLRAGEQLDLTWGDVNNGQLFVKEQKSKARWIPLHPDAQAILDKRRDLPTPFPLAYRCVSRHWRLTLIRAGVQGASWHTNRHTFATSLARAGASLYLISRLLGHGSIAMTMRYVQVCGDDLQDAIRKLR